MLASRDPQSPREWQEAADLANFYLAVQAAAGYGLVTHNLAVDEERCIALLIRAVELGYTPRAPEAVLKDLRS